MGTKSAPGKMYGLHRVNIEMSDKTFRKIEEYMREVAKELGPYLVVLCGSFATGDVREGFDIVAMIVEILRRGGYAQAERIFNFLGLRHMTIMCISAYTLSVREVPSRSGRVLQSRF